MNAFVTGGSRGIGRAIVLKFVQEGWGCAFTFMENQTAAKETIRLAGEINPDVRVQSYQLDVKKSQDVEHIVESAIRDFDDIQAVVNNAAVVKNNAAVMMADEEWTEVVDTNLSGPFFVVRSFLMHLIANRCGSFVNISSLAQDGCSGQVNYAASKAGLIGLTRTVAKEYGPKGITSNVVTVGLVQTDMTDQNLAQNLQEFWMQHCPMKRMGTAEEIAALVYFLCSKEGSFINGEVIRVSGGLTYAP